MKIITLLSQKGGVGKTMTAVSLAIAAELDGKDTVIFDLDPQGTALKWRDRRQNESPAVIAAQHSRLLETISVIKKQGGMVLFIDTAPHSESAALAAARAADFVLIPCRPDIFDLEAIVTSIDTAQLAKKPYAVLLNAVPSRTHDLEHAREALASIEAITCPISITARRAFPRATMTGLTAQEYEPKGKAANETAELYQWLKERISL